MTPNIFSRLHFLLLALVLLALAPALGLALYSSLETRAQAARSAQEIEMHFLRQMAERHARIGKSARQALQLLALSGDFQAKGLSKAAGVFGEVLGSHPEFSNLYLVDANKQVLASGRATAPILPARLLDWAEDGQSGRESGDILAVYHPERRNSSFYSSTPVPGTGEESSKRLILEFNLFPLAESMVRGNLPPDSTFILVHESGNILFRYPETGNWPESGIQEEQVPLLAMGQEEFTASGRGLDGSSRLYAFKRSPLGSGSGSGNIYLRVGMPEAWAFAQADALMVRHLAGMAGVAILVLVAARLFGSRLILRPVGRLVQAAGRIEQGDLGIQLGRLSGPEEFGALARSFDNMSQALSRRSLELLAGQQRLQSLFNATSDGVALLTPEGGILAINKVAAQRRGQAADELVGRNILEFLPNPLAEFRRQRMREVVETGVEASFEEEHDGLYFRINYYPVRDASGQVAQLTSFSRNITESKLGELSLKRLNRHLLALSRCNQSVIYAASEESLAEEICRHIVEIGGHDFAWVTIFNDEEFTPYILSWHGRDKEFMCTVQSSWMFESEQPKLCLSSLRKGRNCIVQDFTRHADWLAWKAVADAHGVKALAVLPLKNGENVFGALCISSGEAHAFGPDELELLTQLAGNISFGLASMRNKEERWRTKKALEKAEQRYRSIIENAPVGIYRSRPEPRGSYIALNPAFANMFGYATPEEALAGVSDISHQLYVNPQRREEMHRELVASGEVKNFEAEMRRKDGSVFWSMRDVRAVTDRDGTIVSYDGFVRDITDRKRAEEQLLYQAFHDNLTDLPNRARFMERLEQSLALLLNSPHSHFGMLFLDIDDFKLINDGFGHVVGDRLLQAFTERLLRCLPPGLLLARFGGDEFAVLLEGVLDQIQVLRACDSIHEALKHPFRVDAYELRVTASVGVVFSKPEYVSPEQVFRDADIAMYRAKARGKGNTEVFDKAMHAQVLDRLELEQELLEALERRDFKVLYQPICRAKDHRLCGFEALVRWRSPSRGPMSPAVFIPMLEETGQILALGEFVLEEACEQMARWLAEYPQDRTLTMHVNLSSHQIFQSDIVATVARVLDKARLDAGYLKLEITESMLMQDMDKAIRELARIRELGVRTAMDDFGTGYSSLGYLRNLPLDAIKMDRSFVVGMEQSDTDAHIVGIIVELAHTLGLEVVAEGVETAEVLSRLAHMGCDMIQGYYFSRPLAPEDMAGFLRDGVLRPALQA